MALNRLLFVLFLLAGILFFQTAKANVLSPIEKHIAQYKATSLLTSFHIAFRAKSREQVKQFYEAALTAGGKCNGAPGLRPQYTETYYAAFIIDPSGYNVEVVSHEPE